MAAGKLIMLAAGGTGGHLFPAEALSHALHTKGMRVVLMTDTRAAEFAGTPHMGVGEVRQGAGCRGWRKHREVKLR